VVQQKLPLLHEQIEQLLGDEMKREK
jgi:hypothetical protein